MGLFRPYEQGKTDEDPVKQGKTGGASAQHTPEASAPAGEPTATAVRHPQKKGVRTPTRAEAEAARRERLHPTLSPKEAKKAQRKAEREARYRQLEAADNSPERRLVRDHVDSQITFTEYTIPIMLVIMVVSLWFSRSLVAQQLTSLAMMGIFLIWIVNITLRWQSFKKLAQSRGLNPKQRGLMMYMINRMMTIRSLRRPEPRIKRGEAY
ncbi:DUF3043 domain-containing protein [Luteococcus sp. Sow4_B9]|uniref:DUF3043 domain-containing protein n=1 Tax=Luteococcus sp. Sow4_B9 TaxID=3438792 RepID=UPI003F992228